MRARDVSGTAAERHLIEAHREALAKLLYEGAMVAYWMAPHFAPPPLTENGHPRLVGATDRWRIRCDQRILRSSPGDDLDLLIQCHRRVLPGSGVALARASLGLVPGDTARYLLAVNLPANRDRTATLFLRRLGARLPAGELRRQVLESLGARLSSLNLLREARSAYLSAVQPGHGRSAVPGGQPPEEFLSRACAFNLSCLLGDEKAAALEASAMNGILPTHPGVLGVKDMLSVWWCETRTPSERAVAQSISERLRGKISDVAQSLCQAFEA